MRLNGLDPDQERSDSLWLQRHFDRIPRNSRFAGGCLIQTRGLSGFYRLAEGNAAGDAFWADVVDPYGKPSAASDSVWIGRRGNYYSKP